MVEITPLHDRLVLEVKGWHKLWALKSQMDIPLEHIKGVHADPHPAMGWFQAWKIAGTDIPNVFRAGLFWQEGNKVFWDVHRAENTVVLELEDEHYAKLIVEVEDPEATVQTIRQAISGYQTAKEAAAKELDQALEDPLTIAISTPVTSATEEATSQVLGQR